MRRGDDPTDIRQLLSQRADALAVLVDGCYQKSDLTDALDVSRSTVDRTIRRLESSGLVRREGTKAEATLAGRLAYDSYRRYCERTATIAQFSDLLRTLPATVDLGYELLDGATAYRSEPPATGRPANEVTALISEGIRLRGCAKVVNDSAAAGAFSRMITERDGCGEVVYTTSLADHIRDEYFRMHHELTSTGRFRAYEIETLPYELFLIAGDGWTRVVVLFYNEMETLQGAITNDTDAAIRWGEDTFERYRRAATEFTDEFRVGTDDTGTDTGTPDDSA